MPAVKAPLSFSHGEVSPPIYARPDLDLYMTGARTLRNWIPRKDGGLNNRCGTRFISEVNNSAVQQKLVPFIFNADQTYVLEFGNLYMRVVKDGAQVTETTKAISAITKASPGRVTTAAHSYATGDEVLLSGIVGMTELNGRNFKITVISGTEFDLYEMDGTTAFNTSAYTAYVSGGASAKVFQLATAYVTADLPTLDTRTQDADVIIVFHKNYAPLELARTADTAWTRTAISFAPSQVAPHGVTAAIGAAGTYSLKYRVTARNDETGAESLPARGATQVISNITQANPAVLTYVGADSFSNDDEVYIEGVVGMTQVNGLTFTVANRNTAANTFELRGINSTAYTAYSSGGTVAMTYARLNNAALADANAHEVAIPVLTGCSIYYVYKSILNDSGGGYFGYIGAAQVTGSPTSGTVSFWDIGRVPDETDGPPNARNPFSAAGDYPACGTIYQGRLIAAGSDNKPTTIEASRSGQLYDFSKSDPIQDDDSVTAKLAGRQVNRILHLIDAGRLIPLTAGGEWAINGDGAGVLTPFDVNARQYSFNGSGDLFPLVVNRTVLYAQAGQNQIRDLLYDFQSDGYNGEDLTVLSRHLFSGHTIVDWAYQQNPDSVIWVVRDDGVLLSFTYLREQNVMAWARHDTDGEFERVIVVPEGTEDALYMIVKRTIGGETKRYIERMMDRYATAQEDLIFVDCSLTYDGAATSTVTGLWHLEGEEVSVQADGFVIANPNDASLATITVTNGTITLPAAFSVIHVGLPYMSDLETLDVDTSPTLAGKQKIVKEVHVWMEKTRGVWVGAKAPDDDDTDPKQGLNEMKPRDTEDYGELPTLHTEVASIHIAGEWSKGGRVFLRQLDPVPATIAALAPEVTIA